MDSRHQAGNGYLKCFLVGSNLNPIGVFCYIGAVLDVPSQIWFEVGVCNILNNRWFCWGLSRDLIGAVFPGARWHQVVLGPVNEAVVWGWGKWGGGEDVTWWIISRCVGVVELVSNFTWCAWFVLYIFVQNFAKSWKFNWQFLKLLYRLLYDQNVPSFWQSVIKYWKIAVCGDLYLASAPFWGRI